jgi:hypothetical protein
VAPSRLRAPTVVLPASADVLHLEIRDLSGQLAESMRTNRIQRRINRRLAPLR